MSEVVKLLQKTAVKQLNLKAQDTLGRDPSSILAVAQQREDILFRFTEAMNAHFDRLLGTAPEKEEVVFNFETLALVQEEELDVMVAVEGMVAAARNQHLPHFISFNTRLNSLFTDIRIDESTNPLDPEQIAVAFQEALRPVHLDAQNSLRVYRAFNVCVLKELNQVLSSANQLLIEHGVIPELGLDSARPTLSRPTRNRSRQQTSSEDVSSFGSIESEPYDRNASQPELFSMMQNLMHGEIQGGSGRSEPGPSQTVMVPASTVNAATNAPMQPATVHGQVEVLDQGKLLEILTSIQRSIEDRAAPDEVSEQEPTVNKLDIAESLGERLQIGPQGIVTAVDQQSSDIINLVTMLYEAIWQDESVPIPIKELIGRTQITIIKVALTDTTFFNLEDHPVRALLNEFAAAGIGWNEVEELEEDPLYVKMEEVVGKILEDYRDQDSFFADLLTDFKSFRAREAAKTRKLEQRILRAKERQERLEDIRELVSQKIDERILGRDLDDFVNQVLHAPFHKFMELLVLKEGPSGNAWRQALNTIDVLMWSVQPHEHAGDRERLETVNPRLLNNLRKAFRIAQLEPGEIDSLITRLKTVQDATFVHEPGAASITSAAATTAMQQIEAPAADSEMGAEEDLAEDDPVLTEVDRFSVGVWVEFLGPSESENVRCKLAAKINAIDKYIFVNRQGVKVVEKTRKGLALELKHATVRVISDGLLFSRALESVIGNLRETQHEQQTGSAYRPNDTIG